METEEVQFIENDGVPISLEKMGCLLEITGAFHLGKKPGNFGGSKSGISDW